jgi:hypothetical protein
MKHVLLVAALIAAGCGKKKDKPPPPDPYAPSAGTAAASGSAGSAPAAGSSDMGSGSAGSGSAAAPSKSFEITEAGMGPIEVKVADDSDDGIKSHLEKALAPYPELSVSFEVMEDENETEEGYFAVKRGETEVLQVMRPSFTGGKDLELHALDPMFQTKIGVKPGMFARELDHIPDIACTAKKDNRLGLLTCIGKSEPKIIYVLNAQDYKGKSSAKGVPVGLAEIASRPIFEIVR